MMNAAASRHLVRYCIRLTTSVLFLALVSLRAHAAVEARVDDTSIDSMQTVLLQLRITGTNDVDQLDISPLEQDFEIQGTSQQSQLRMVNGQVSSWVDFQITLRPKRTGTLTIPALRVEGEQSEPITINVRAIDSSLQDTIDRLVYFDVELDRSEVYVQAELLYTRRLYYTSGVQIYGDLPGAPAVQNAVVLTLGETTQNITMRGDTRYGVLEQRYAIFPERSGALSIPGFSVAASVVLPDGRRGIRVPAPDRTITVLPIPESYPGDTPWLPARSVSLSETWDPPALTGQRSATAAEQGHASTDVPLAAIAVDAGQSLQRTIVVDVTGNGASAVPPLNTDAGSPLMRHYPQPPEMADDLFGAHVTGRRTQAERLVPAWGGDLAIPPLTLTWWDTEARVVRESKLTGRHFVIRGEAPPVSADSPASQTTGTSGEKRANDTDSSDRTGTTISELWHSARSHLDRSVLLLALGSVLLAVVLGLLTRTLTARVRSGSAPDLKRLRRDFQAAIDQATPGEIREKLIHIAMLTTGQSRSRIQSLIESDPEWFDLHSQLGRVAYASGTAEPTPTVELRKRATVIATRLTSKTRPSGTPSLPTLPPLYQN